LETRNTATSHLLDPHLQEEAEAFDEHARERIDHGLIPDLRRAEPCDWFYNNPWRRPYAAQMVFGRYLQFALANITGKTLLEVGSGVGHMSLEFARHGYDVTGLELSEVAVRAAQGTAAQNPFTDGFGSLNYVVADYLQWQPNTRFDNICFFGALHHFEDVEKVVEKAWTLLNEKGRIVVIEPARDWLHEGDGALIALIRVLLSAHGGWYENVPLPQNRTELDTYANECLREYRDATDKSEAAQSPHDNASFAEDMLRHLRDKFTELALEPGFAFLPRMIGGLRAASEEQARELAEFLCLFDEYVVKHKLMNAGGFLWAGEKN